MRERQAQDTLPGAREGTTGHGSALGRPSPAGSWSRVLGPGGQGVGHGSRSGDTSRGMRAGAFLASAMAAQRAPWGRVSVSSTRTDRAQRCL